MFTIFTCVHILKQWCTLLNRYAKSKTYIYKRLQNGLQVNVMDSHEFANVLCVVGGRGG